MRTMCASPSLLKAKVVILPEFTNPPVFTPPLHLVAFYPSPDTHLPTQRNPPLLQTPKRPTVGRQKNLL